MKKRRSETKKTRRPIKPYRERRAKALKERKKRARALTRAGDLRLAKKLKGCSSRQRCASGACPLCHVHIQQRLARALRRLAKQARGEGLQVVVLTWVPSDAGVAPGQLGLRDHDNQMRVWKRRLASTNLVWFVGGLDFSYNVDRQGIFQPHWSPHLYGLGLTPDPVELRRELKRLAPATLAVPRPVKVTPWDGRLNAALYSFKDEFTRRVSFLGERYDPRQGKMTPCRRTSKQRLLAIQKLELLKHLDQIGLARRIFSLKAQVHRNQRRVAIRRL